MTGTIGRPCVLLALAAAASLAPLQAQSVSNGEWHFYASDAHSTKYSALDQINAANISQLHVAWQWDDRNMGPRPDPNWEVTPLMVNGVLYFTAGIYRTAVAVDAATGETLWIHRLDDHVERGAVRVVNRGLAYWKNPSGDDRILVITPGYQLAALDAKTGEPIPNFGASGLVDLWKGLDRPEVKPDTIGATSPPIVIRDVVVVGASLKVAVAMKDIGNVPGYIRGYDIHTGKLLWTFHTIPQKGEFGINTWLNDAWKFTGNAGAWGPLTGDEETGYVYIPVEAPTGDLYGGQRPGANLFGNSIVCLDARTGKRIWHFQTLHHEMWDYDIPAAPVLVDVNVDGKPIKAVAVVTKEALIFVFDRLTGKPIWPIVETPVPKGDVPGEWYSPTQPIPTKPKAFDRQGVTPDDLIDFTPEIKAEALKVASKYKLGPLYTPPIVYDSDGGKEGTLQLPGAGGGANWQGAAADPETGMIYIPSTTSPYLSALTHDPSRSKMEYIVSGKAHLQTVMGLPIIKPPYGRITAIDLNTGEHAWMVPNGETPEGIKDNPLLKAAGIDTSKFGGPGRAPLLVTKTLLFAGGGKTFRALNKKTGDTVFSMQLPANDTGGPMTYMMNGKQYIVVAVSGRGGNPELVALTVGTSEEEAPGRGGKGGRGGRGPAN